MPSSLLRVNLSLIVLSLCSSAAAAPFTHRPPQKVPAYQPLVIEGELDDAEDLEGLVLRLRSPGGAFQDFRLALEYGDLYRATVPAERVTPPAIEYYIEGYDQAGQRRALFMTAAKPARVQVTPGKPPPGATTKPWPEPDPEPAPIAKQSPPAKAEQLAEPEAPPAIPAPSARIDPLGTGTTARANVPDAGSSSRALSETSAPPRNDATARAMSPDAGMPSRVRPDYARGETQSDAPGRSESAASAAVPDGGTTARSKPNVSLKDPPAATAAASGQQETTRSGTSEKDNNVKSGTVQLTPSEMSSVATTWVFTAEQLRRLGVRRLSELVDRVPGMHSARDVQGFARSGFRGLLHDGDVLVLVDGVRLNTLYEGRPSFDWPLANAKQVSIRVGRAIDVGAPGNFRAVIRITTARSEALQAEVSGGYPLGIEGHASGHVGFNALRLFADADFNLNHGVALPILKDSIDQAAKAQQLRFAENPAGYTDESALGVHALGGLEWDRGDNGILRLSVRYSFARRGALVGVYSTVAPGSSLEAHAFDVLLQYRRSVSQRVTFDTQGWFQQQTAVRSFQLSPPGFQTSTASSGFFPEGIREFLRAKERGLGADMRFTFDLATTHKLIAGLSVERTGLYDYEHLTNLNTDDTFAGRLIRVAPERLIPGVTPEPVLHRIATGAFADYRWDPRPAFTVSLSARADLWQVPVSDEASVVMSMRWLPVFSPRVGVAWRPANSLVARLSFTHSGSAASIKEQLGSVPGGTVNAGRGGGDPSLAGFESDTAELGLLWQTAVARGRVRVEAVGFFERTGALVGPIRTLGANVYGGEASARLEWSPRLQGWLTVSTAQVVLRELPEGEQHRSSVPRLLAGAGLSVPLGPYLALDGEARFVSAIVPVDAPREAEYQLPSYLSLGAQLRTEWLLKEHLQLAVGIYDLTVPGAADPAAAPTAMPSGIPRQPFSARLTLRVKL